MTVVTERYANRPPGPCFGQHGLLTHIGDKIQCHFCGNAFHSLVSHINRRHLLSAREYKDAFGLHHSLGLTSDDLHHRLSSISVGGIKTRKYDSVGVYVIGCLVCNAPVSSRRSRKLSKAPVTCGQAECVMAAKIRKLKPWRTGVPLPETTKARLREIMSGPSVEKPCVICGRLFLVKPCIAERVTTCGAECRAARRRKIGATWAALMADSNRGVKVNR